MGRSAMNHQGIFRKFALYVHHSTSLSVLQLGGEQQLVVMLTKLFRRLKVNKTIVKPCIAAAHL